MPESKGNGEEAVPQTLDEIMAATWNETMGEDTEELPIGFEHLGNPNDPDEEVMEASQEEDPEPAEEDVDTPEEEPVDESTDDEMEQETETSSLSAPDHWSRDDREMFSSLDEGAKKFLLRRHKDMEGDYTRKTQENADAIKIGRIIDESMDPAIKADLRRLGVDNESYLRQMMQWHHQSATDPAGFARQIVQQLRLDPAQVFQLTQDQNGEENTQTDPTAQRLAAVENHLAQDQQSRLEQLQREQQARVDNFKDLKDESGNLVHPHFERVRKDMALIVRADPTTSLEDAYSMAVYKDPELRQSLIAPQTEETNVTETSERTKKALRAKSSNIKSRTKSSVDVQKDDTPMSLQAAMNAAADELGL